MVAKAVGFDRILMLSHKNSTFFRIDRPFLSTIYQQLIIINLRGVSRIVVILEFQRGKRRVNFEDSKISLIFVP